MKMTPKQIQLLNRACKMAGVDTSKISPSSDQLSSLSNGTGNKKPALRRGE